MNTTIRKTILAAAVATICATPAFASQPNDHETCDTCVNIDKDISLKTDIEIDGAGRDAVEVMGFIPVSSAGVALTDTQQNVSNNQGYNHLLSNDAYMGDNAASGASGNIGINTAAGDNNAQSNAAALAAADAQFLFGMEIGGIADAETFADQNAQHIYTDNYGASNNAGLYDSALEGASGNIGVNMAAGNSNAQQNNLAASVVSNTSMAQATTSTNQNASNNATSNAGYVEKVYDTVAVNMHGNVDGYTAAVGYGGYEGHSSGSYSGSEWGGYSGYEAGGYAGAAWGEYSGDTSGKYYGSAEGKVKAAYDGCGGDSRCGGYSPTIAKYEGHESGKYHGSESGSYSGGEVGGYLGHEGGSYSGGEAGSTYAHEEGQLGFVEFGAADLYANLSGEVVTTRWIVQNAENSAGLSDNALAGASGNIGVNLASGTGNLQANSLSMAVTCNTCQ
ncbi:MAG TPA: adhesin [Chromatiales bacterium]|nr:adhesin [Chromatiales bacterium]